MDGIDQDVESWDAIAVARWGKCAKWARQQADDVPYEQAALILLNVFEPWLESERLESEATVAGDLPAEVRA